MTAAPALAGSRSSHGAVWPLVAGLLVAGCVAVTINVTFPQEKIESAASNIEDLVRSPGPPPPANAPAPPVPSPDAPAQPSPPRSAAPSGWLAWLGPAPAEAQVPELRTRTPEVMAAINSRRARYPALAQAMTRGCVGENNRGLVEARPGTDCPPDVVALVTAENDDRARIYRTLVEQNNMPPGDIVRVQAAFARVNRDAVAAGTWIQDDAGNWTRK
jgi:uncharacterized protein YdbL (DUF1318 family)